MLKYPAAPPAKTKQRKVQVLNGTETHSLNWMQFLSPIYRRSQATSACHTAAPATKTMLQSDLQLIAQYCRLQNTANNTCKNCPLE